MDEQIVVYPYNGMLLRKKKKDLVIDITTQIRVKIVMPSENCQIRRTPCVIPFIYSVKCKLVHSKWISDCLQIVGKGSWVVHKGHEENFRGN